jgi:hypothetical protein
MTEKKISDLSLSRVECEHCGATWINGKHYWKTGCTSDDSELNLASLVCDTDYGNPKLCINKMKGTPGGDTWEKRLGTLKKLEKDYGSQNTN